jgi:hypothetical protein
MELVQILRTLWQRRILVALAGIVALLAAATVLYRPTLPPESRATSVGAASTEILVDAPKSTLGDFQRDITPFVARGGIFSRFLLTEEGAKGIGRESGIPARDITVAGPKLSIEGVPDQASAKRAIALGGSGRYLVQVQQGDDLPLLTIYTQAPTAEGARRLANGTAAALDKMVTDAQVETDVPDQRRLTIRQLGEARAGELSEKPSVALAVVVFFGVLAALCMAILVGPWLLSTWRSQGTASTAPADTNGHDLGPFDDAPGFSLVPAESDFVFERPDDGGDAVATRSSRR